VTSLRRAGFVVGLATVGGVVCYPTLIVADQRLPHQVESLRLPVPGPEVPDMTQETIPPTTTTTTAPATTTTTPEVTPEVMATWEKVAICEEGGNWAVRGSTYSGGLGISNVNWVAYGGTQFAANAADATPEEQVIIARRIQLNPPDQYGCASW